MNRDMECVLPGETRPPLSVLLHFAEKDTTPGETHPSPRKSSPNSARTTSWMGPTSIPEKYRSEARSFLEKQSSLKRTLVTSPSAALDFAVFEKPASGGVGGWGQWSSIVKVMDDRGRKCGKVKRIMQITYNPQIRDKHVACWSISLQFVCMCVCVLYITFLYNYKCHLVWYPVFSVSNRS